MQNLDLQLKHGLPTKNTPMSELMYANDTLVVAADAEKAGQGQCMTCIHWAGRAYGMALNWSKAMALPVRGEIEINKPDGTRVQCAESLCYLGSLLTASGSIAPELRKRTGAARAEFHTLKRIWAHSSLNIGKKIRILHACVLSRRLNCFCTVCTQLGSRRPTCRNSMHFNPCACDSRVSNVEILRRAAPGFQDFTAQAAIVAGSDRRFSL